jgi:transposase
VCEKQIIFNQLRYSRKRINLTGAINLITMKAVTCEYETINGSTTVEFLKAIEHAYPNAKTIHLIADGASDHTSHEVALFLSYPNAVNRDHLEQTHDIKLPVNNGILTKKMKHKLSLILEKDGVLFNDKLILNTDQLTSKQLLDSLKKPPPHPTIVMRIPHPYSSNLNLIERLLKVMNESSRNNQVFKTFKEFKEKIHGLFNDTWGKISDNFRTRINDDFQTLKPVI